MMSAQDRQQQPRAEQDQQSGRIALPTVQDCCQHDGRRPQCRGDLPAPEHAPRSPRSHAPHNKSRRQHECDRVVSIVARQFRPTPLPEPEQHDLNCCGQLLHGAHQRQGFGAALRVWAKFAQRRQHVQQPAPQLTETESCDRQPQHQEQWERFRRPQARMGSYPATDQRRGQHAEQQHGIKTGVRSRLPPA